MNGCTTASGSSIASASIHVLSGSTIVTPASMCASLMRSRSAAAAAASSTRVFTPSVSTGSPPLCTATRSPSSTRMRDRVGQVELALRVVRRQPVEHRPQPICAEDVDRRVDLAHRALLVRRVTMLDDRIERHRPVTAAHGRTASGRRARRREPLPQRARGDASRRARAGCARSGAACLRRGRGRRRLCLRGLAARSERRLPCRAALPAPRLSSPSKAAAVRRRGDDDERIDAELAGGRRAPSRPSGARGSDGGASERRSACAFRDRPP